MLRKTLASWSLAAAMLGAAPAQAIVVHVDDASTSVVRPQGGSVFADFTGSVDYTPGFDNGGVSIQSPYTAGETSGGHGLVRANLTSAFRAPGVLFSFVITATDAAGLYATNFLGNALSVIFSECPIAISGNCNNTSFQYTLEVLEPAADVPEPASLALVGAALAGLGLVRRRRTRKARVTAR